MREESCGFKAIFEWVRGRIRSKVLRIRSRLWKDCWLRMMITIIRMMGKMMRVLPIRDDEREGKKEGKKKEGKNERGKRETRKERKKEKKVPNVIVLIAFGSRRYDTKQKHTPKTPDTSKHFKRVYSILLHPPPPPPILPTLPHHHLQIGKKEP